MGINTILLTVAAILPAVALCIYVFKKDRVEKEPMGLLLGLLGLGVVICFPAAFVESILTNIIDGIFLPFCVEVDGGYVIENGFIFRIYNAMTYFLNVALVEEGFKFAVLFLVTRNNKNFNSLFDGLIYSVFVSLGFAGFENILYVTQYGWANAVMRAVMSVPAHMFFSVMMGYYYSMWHMKVKARNIENNLKAQGIISPSSSVYSSGKDLAMCLIVPILFHGLYDYCCTINTVAATLVFYGFLLFMYIYCFRRIKKMSNMDMDDNRYASALVAMRHPEYLQLLKQIAQRQLEEQERIQAMRYQQQPQYAVNPLYRSAPAPVAAPAEAVTEAQADEETQIPAEAESEILTE